MALLTSKHLSDSATETPKKSWLETLRRWRVQCPNCSKTRLVVGARENELYTCKDCGHRFAIRISGWRE